jgi:hypothetical protein
MYIPKGVGCMSDRPSLPSRLAYEVAKVLLFGCFVVAMKSCKVVYKAVD